MGTEGMLSDPVQIRGNQCLVPPPESNPGHHLFEFVQPLRDKQPGCQEIVRPGDEEIKPARGDSDRAFGIGA
jgi:hypothetical protein